MKVVLRFPNVATIHGNELISRYGNKKITWTYLGRLHSRYRYASCGFSKRLPVASSNNLRKVSVHVPKKNAFNTHEYSWKQQRARSSRYVSNQGSDEAKNQNQAMAKEQDSGTSSSPQETFMSTQTRNQIESLLTQAQSIPNIITLSRIASTPLLAYFIINNQYDLAIFGCILAGISDYADGYIAKNYNAATVLGTYLDPLADKIFINGLAISLTVSGVLPIWCCFTWLGRDVLLIGMSYKMVAKATEGTGHAVMNPDRTPLKIEPSLISKGNTVLQFGTLSLGMGAASWYGGNVADVGLWDISIGDCVVGMNLMESMSLITCGTTVWSGMGYLDGKSVTSSDNASSDSTKSVTVESQDKR